MDAPDAGRTSEPELELLRTWGANLTEPPAHLQAHIEEQLWEAILAEEASRAHARRSGRPSRGRRGWLSGLLRPAVAAGAAAMLAVGVAVTSSRGPDTPTSPRSGGVVQAGGGILDAAALSLFGDARASGGGAISGQIDVRPIDEDVQWIIDGPQVDATGSQLQADTRARVASVTRDPAQLQEAIRDAAARLVGSDPHDRIAFHLAMQWVVASEVPTDLRAAMIRSLDGLDGLDPATPSVDLLGRRGLLIGHLDESTGLREQYLLHSDGATLIERRGFTTSPVVPACPAGTIVDHALYDDSGEAINPASTPWLAWPPVVPACMPGAPGQ